MKHWKCPNCGREHESKEEIVISICRGCLNKMKEVKEDGKWEKR